MEKLDILKALVLDDEDEIIYKESFKISHRDLEVILNIYYDGYEDVDEFMENYEPDSDGVEIYAIARKLNFNIEEEIIDVFGEEEAEDGVDLDLDDYESLDDLEESAETEKDDEFDDLFGVYGTTENKENILDNELDDLFGTPATAVKASLSGNTEDDEFDDLFVNSNTEKDLMTGQPGNGIDTSDEEDLLGDESDDEFDDLFGI